MMAACLYPEATLVPRLPALMVFVIVVLANQIYQRYFDREAIPVRRMTECVCHEIKGVIRGLVESSGGVQTTGKRAGIDGIAL
jgi:hypothetical protein